MTDTDEARDSEMPATVLVVDDSLTVRKILRRILEGEGLSVVEAPNGQEALSLCLAHAPDAMLLDVDMPVMGGWETLAAMQAIPSLTEIPVLMLTARTTSSDLARGLQSGAQDYLRKPCEPEELVARVKTALALKRRRDELRRRADELLAMGCTDELTGLGNRRYLDLRLGEWTRKLGGPAPISALLLDIDHFKVVNDTQGHLAGDVVLRELARRIRSVVGDDQAIIRWGGEEFLVLAPTLNSSRLGKLGEIVRMVVAAEPFSVSESTSLSITLSGGCAGGPIEDIGEVISAADSALYRAKNSGRNRVIVT